MSNTKSFTLIELLIVIGVLAVLVAAIVVTLNPAQLLAQARDSKRQQDLSALNQSLNTITALDQSLFMGTSSIVYTSLPDSSSTCGSWNLPSLPSGWQYHCSPTTTLQNTDGNGWIPVNFKTTGVISLSSLPIDPINTSSTGLYYTYVSGGSFELTAAFESSKFKLGGDKDIVSTDGGLYPDLYEVGSNLSLQPLDHGDTSLVGYWNFSNGTGTIAYDKSSSGTNIPWTGMPTYSLRNVNSWAVLVSNSNYLMTTTPSAMLINAFQGSFTISHWFNFVSVPSNGWQGVVCFRSSPWPGFACTMNGSISLPLMNGVISHSNNSSNGTPSYTSSIGAWHEITFVHDNIALHDYEYIDGSLFSDAPSTHFDPVSSPIGLYMGGLNASYNGYISDVRIYNRALSASEVQALYNATK